MTLEGLRMFCAVVEEGSFRGAAARLHRSQPAVSQQVKALEQEAGHVLLERRGCRLTPAGERLFTRATRILHESDNLARELRDFDESQSHELRVGTSDTTALYVLPPVVRAFSAAMPETHLVLISRTSAAIADQVRLGELDLGIVTLPVSRKELEERDLWKQQLVLVTPKRHPLGRRGRVRLEDLAHEPLLLIHDQTQTGALLREHFRKQGFQPQTVLDSASFEVIKRYIAEGIGLSFLPSEVITAGDKDLATVVVPGLPSVRIGVIWRRHAYRTKAARTFIELVSAGG